MRRTLLSLTAILTCVALAAGACGDDSDASQDDASSTTASDGESASGPEVPDECDEPVEPEALAEVEERGAPEPAAPEGGEPADLVEGSGDEVAEGDSLQMHVVLSTTDGEVLQSTWEQGAPVDIDLGTELPSLAAGLVGMAEGGRRVLLVPATELFEGEEPPAESGIAADDEIVFTVDLVETGEALEDADALAAAEERGAPEIDVPDEAPGTLEWTDDVEGDGEPVCPGATVLAHYTGVDLSSGETFDSSWDRGEPSSFSLDGVIPGWTEGLVGMKVGGRRTLVIPGEMAYGESDEDSAGQPTGALVFTVDLIGVG